MTSDPQATLRRIHDSLENGLCLRAWEEARSVGPLASWRGPAGRVLAGRLAAALGPREGPARDYWQALFRATYRAEFRVEKAGRENDILAVNAGHFEGLLPLAWEAGGIAFDQRDGVLSPRLGDGDRRMILAWWRLRARLSKPLNVVRLVKASTTFDGAARYAAWKIERHTGVAVELTPWREKHPVLAAPAVLWKIWRTPRSPRT
jgi:hypothetical protein